MMCPAPCALRLLLIMTMLCQGAYAANIAVIGAGLAGLSAARHLVQQGLRPQIFEARERPGGRVLTTPINERGLTVEAGGTFIDSDQRHIIELARDLDVELLRVINDNEALHYQFFNQRLSTSRDNFSLFKETLSTIHNDRIVGQELRNMSMANYLAGLLAPAELRALVNLIMQNEYGADPEHIRADELHKVIKFDLERQSFSINGHLGDEAMIIKGGGQALINKLASSLNTDINYSHELKSIIQEGAHYVLGFDTPAGFFKTSVDKVIITLPLEIIREQLIIDVPQFPEHLATFITHRPMGKNFKIWLFFDQACWLDLPHGNSFTFLTENYWIWDNSDTIQGHNTFGLTAFVGGSNAERASRLSDQHIEREVLDALSMLMPHIREHHLLTRRGHEWHHDRFSQGSYTGIVAPGMSDDFEAFERPFHEGLLFAGEAWDEKYDGFMNGAVATGQRAAMRLLGALTTPSEPPMLGQ